MSYGILPYMTSIDDLKSIWNCKIQIGARDVRTQMEEKLGYQFLPRETSTDWLKRFNIEMKKNQGYPDFRSHVAMQDLFNGEITYSKSPWIYSYLLEGIVFNLSQDYFRKVAAEFKVEFPNIPLRTEDFKPTNDFLDYQYSRLLLKSCLKACHLPNSEWYPCDLSIINELPSSLPMPIPEADDFPFVSSIYHKDLRKVIQNINFDKFSLESKEQMNLWFNKADSEGRDLILFIY